VALENHHLLESFRFAEFDLISSASSSSSSASVLVLILISGIVVVVVIGGFVVVVVVVAFFKSAYISLWRRHLWYLIHVMSLAKPSDPVYVTSKEVTLNS
jgi:hypothetical protein